jgi:hypothetical protein
MQEYDEDDEIITLTSVEFKIPIVDMYSKVILEPVSQEGKLTDK